jgi:hypothetical protein
MLRTSRRGRGMKVRARAVPNARQCTGHWQVRAADQQHSSGMSRPDRGKGIIYWSIGPNQNQHIYHCFFFAEGVIRYWENVKCLDVNLQALLRSRLLNGKWQLAEAWAGETLICRVERNAAGLRPALAG